MLPLLALIPVGTSLILGVVFLFLGEARPGVKGLGTIVFFIAVYLQFFSTFSLPGMLLQIVLALCLAWWRQTSTST
jgi:hypothetical protein